MFVAYEDANDVADRFLDLLRTHNINPPVGSSLEDELLSVAQLVEVYRNPDLASSAEQVAILHAAAGIHDLAAKVLSIETIAEFSIFLPHLRLIAEAKHKPASIRQNAPASNDTARKMAELYIGCLAAHIGTEVNLDSPTASRGDNPDVIFTAQDDAGGSAKQWALAIKSITSKSGQTIFERIAEGAKQIDDPKCPANIGMVVINASSALDHQALWATSFHHVQPAIDLLTNQLHALALSSDKDRPEQEWNGIFQGRVVRPVLFLGQSVVRVDTPLQSQTPTPLKVLVAYDAQGNSDPAGLSLGHEMNHFMQIIRRGISGGPGQLPS